MVAYDNQPSTVTFLSNANSVFSIVFAIEMFFKIFCPHVKVLKSRVFSGEISFSNP